MIPATPQQLDALADAVTGHTPISADSIPDAVRYRSAQYLPNLAARLHAAETELAALRRAVAMHAARVDIGEDVTVADLLTDIERQGVSLAEERAAVAEELLAMYAVETRW